MTTSQELDGQATDGTGGRHPELPPFDAERAEAAVRELLIAIGEDPDREGLRDTPGRVARSYQELFSGLRADPPPCSTARSPRTTTSSSSSGTSRCSRCASTTCCPSTGSRTSPTSPVREGRVTGLSKLARLVDLYARRPQVQERLTTPDRRRPRRAPRHAGCARGDRRRAPVHVVARRPQARGTHDDVGRARQLQDVGQHPGGGPQPHPGRLRWGCPPAPSRPGRTGCPIRAGAS